MHLIRYEEKDEGQKEFASGAVRPRPPGCAQTNGIVATPPPPPCCCIDTLICSQQIKRMAQSRDEPLKEDPTNLGLSSGGRGPPALQS